MLRPVIGVIERTNGCLGICAPQKIRKDAVFLQHNMQKIILFIAVIKCIISSTIATETEPPFQTTVIVIFNREGQRNFRLIYVN